MHISIFFSQSIFFFSSSSSDSHVWICFISDIKKKGMNPLYLSVCIPIRLLLCLLIRLTPRVPTSLLLGVISVFFLVRFLSYSPFQTGGLGGLVWWNELRPLHSILYLLASVSVWHEKKDVSSYILFCDVLLSLTSSYHHHAE